MPKRVRIREFSRQYKWIIANIAAGLCGQCRKPRGNSPSKISCLACLEKRRDYERKRYRRMRCQ